MSQYDISKPLKSFTMQPAKMSTCCECGEKCYKSDLEYGMCPDCNMESQEQMEHQRIERGNIRRF